jgi:serine/threonine-protein kinase
VPVPAGTTSAGAPPAGEATVTATATPPAGDADPPTDPPEATDPPPGGRTLTSSAGSVVAQCTGGKALLTSWTPAEGYKVERVNAGPILAATAVFRQKAARVRMTVTCVAGIPTAVVLPL